MQNLLKVALAQIAPVWLNKTETLNKVQQSVIAAAKENCELIVFGEGLVPGYPFWLALTGGAEWNKTINKELHAHYVKQSVTIEKGDLNDVCKLAKQYKIAIYLGIIERPLDRGGHLCLIGLY
jgi:nitrilase